VSLFVTECKNCIFLKENNCELGRLEKFKKLGKVDNYIVKGICNTFRNEKWAERHTNYVEEALEEVKVKVDVVILDNVEKVLPSLRNLEGIKPYHVFIEGNDDYHKFIGDDVTCVWTLVDDLPKACLPKFKTEYVLFLNDVIPDNYLEKLNQLKNYDLREFLLSKGDPFPLLVSRVLLTAFYEKHNWEEILEKIHHIPEKFVECIK